jgi:hypothetical protein
MDKNSQNIEITDLSNSQKYGFMLVESYIDQTPVLMEAVDEMANRISSSETLLGDLSSNKVFLQRNWSGDFDAKTAIAFGPSNIKYWVPDISGYQILPTRCFWKSSNISFQVEGELRMAAGFQLLANIPNPEGRISCAFYYSNTLYVGMADSPKIYSTTNNGTSWTLVKDFSTDSRTDLAAMGYIKTLKASTVSTLGVVLFIVLEKTDHTANQSMIVITGAFTTDDPLKTTETEQDIAFTISENFTASDTISGTYTSIFSNTHMENSITARENLIIDSGEVKEGYYAGETVQVQRADNSWFSFVISTIDNAISKIYFPVGSFPSPTYSDTPKIRKTEAITVDTFSNFIMGRRIRFDGNSSYDNICAQGKSSNNRIYLVSPLNSTVGTSGTYTYNTTIFNYDIVLKVSAVNACQGYLIKYNNQLYRITYIYNGTNDKTTYSGSGVPVLRSDGYHKGKLSSTQGLAINDTFNMTQKTITIDNNLSAGIQNIPIGASFTKENCFYLNAQSTTGILDCVLNTSVEAFVLKTERIYTFSNLDKRFTNASDRYTYMSKNGIDYSISTYSYATIPGYNFINITDIRNGSNEFGLTAYATDGSTTSKVYKFNGTTFTELCSIPLTTILTGIVYDSSYNLWVTGYPQGRIWQIISGVATNITTLSTGEFTSTYPSNLLIWNTELYIGNSADGTVYKINPASHAVSQVGTFYPSPSSTFRCTPIFGTGTYLFIDTNDNNKTYYFDPNNIPATSDLISSIYDGFLPGSNKLWLYATVQTLKWTSDNGQSVRLQVSTDNGDTWKYCPTTIGGSFSTSPTFPDPNYENKYNVLNDNINHRFFFPYNIKNHNIAYRVISVKGTTTEPVIKLVGLYYKIIEPKEFVLKYSFKLDKMSETIDNRIDANRHNAKLAFLSDIWKNDKIVKIKHINNTEYYCIPYKDDRDTGGGLKIQYFNYLDQKRNRDDLEYLVQINFKTIETYNG